MPQTDPILSGLGGLNRAGAVSARREIVLPKIQIPEELRSGTRRGAAAREVADPLNGNTGARGSSGARAAEASREELRKEIENLNSIAEQLGHRRAYDLFEGSDEFYAKVIDRVTGELIKTLPAQDFLDLRAKLQEVVGALIDEVA